MIAGLLPRYGGEMRVYALYGKGGGALRSGYFPSSTG